MVRCLQCSRWSGQLGAVLVVMFAVVSATAALGDSQPSVVESSGLGSEEGIAVPHWLERGGARRFLESDFWNTASTLQLPTHNPFTVADDEKEGPTCKTRAKHKSISSLYAFEHDGLHLAGDIEVIVLLKLHERSHKAFWRKDACRQVSIGRGWLQVELVRLVVQVVNTLNVFGRFSFGAEILDTCNSAQRVQEMLQVNGNVAELTPCATGNCQKEQQRPRCPSNNSLSDQPSMYTPPSSATSSKQQCQKRGIRTVVVGPSDSKICHASAPFASYNKLTQIAHSATRPDLSNREHFPDLFRTAPSDLLMVRAIVDVLEELGARHVALLVEDSTLGQELRHAFQEHYRHCIALQAFFTAAGNESLRSALTVLSNGQAVSTVVVLGSQEAAVSLLSESGHTLPNASQYLWLATHMTLTWSPTADVRVLTFEPVPQASRFTQRTWPNIQSLLTERAQAVEFSYSDLSLNPWLNKTFRHLSKAQYGTEPLLPKNCTEKSADASRCDILSNFTEEVNATLADLGAVNELKRLMESLMTMVEVTHSLMQGYIARCQKLKYNIEIAKETSTNLTALDSELSASQNNTLLMCRSYTEKYKESTQHCCGISKLLSPKSTRQFTAPAQPVPGVTALFCNLQQSHFSAELLRRGLTGDDPKQAAYDIIAHTGAMEGSSAGAWQKLGHWEAPDLSSAGPSSVSIFPDAADTVGDRSPLSAFLSSHRSSSCSASACAPGTRLVVGAHTDKCCFRCEDCLDSYSSANGSQVCRQCGEYTLPELPRRATMCAAIPVTVSAWDQAWSVAVAAMSGVAVGLVVFAVAWSLRQVETTHRARRKPSLTRLTSTGSNVTSTSKDSVSTKPGGLHYTVLAFLLAGCLINLSLPWPPSHSLCLAQQLSIPMLTPFVCSAMMLTIINKHRWTFVTELVSWRRDSQAVGSHRYMGGAMQAILAMACWLVLCCLVVGSAVASENVTTVQEGRNVHRLCSLPAPVMIAYFVYQLFIFGALFSGALHSVLTAQKAGVIFSRPTSIAWASGGLFFLWLLLLPAHFVLPLVNPSTVLALVNNTHTLVLLAIACRADIRVVRRRQRTTSSLSFNIVGSTVSAGNMEATSPGTTGTSAAHSPAYVHSQTTNVTAASPLSPLPQHQQPGRTPTSGGGGAQKLQRFTFDKCPEVHVTDAPRVPRPTNTISLSRQGSRVGDFSPMCDDKTAANHLNTFNSSNVNLPEASEEGVVLVKTTAL